MQNLMLAVRDLAKEIFRFKNQVFARLFYIKRGKKSSISMAARLDVKRNGSAESFTCFVGERSFIESQVVLNCWHGDLYIGDNTGSVLDPLSLGQSLSVQTAGQVNMFSFPEKTVFIQGQSLG